MNYFRWMVICSTLIARAWTCFGCVNWIQYVSSIDQQPLGGRIESHSGCNIVDVLFISNLMIFRRFCCAVAVRQWQQITLDIRKWASTMNAQKMRWIYGENWLAWRSSMRFSCEVRCKLDIYSSFLNASHRGPSYWWYGARACMACRWTGC